LYYCRNFRIRCGTEVSHDLVDIGKLAKLFGNRRPHIASIFTSDTLDWINEPLGNLARTGVNEYMCHEGGHALGVPVSEKYRRHYFRLGGRLRWPLVYMEPRCAGKGECRY
jgi:hypothetical protein